MFIYFKLFGSVAPILDSVGEKTNQIDTSKVQSSALFSLLEAMERNLPDSLRILELVKMNESSSSSSSAAVFTTTSTSAAAAAAAAGAVPVAYQVSSGGGGSGGGATGGTSGNESGGTTVGTSGAGGQQSLVGGLQTQQSSYLSPSLGQFSSPASLLTAAGSSSAVLAVSGIQATNLLITSSGALGFNQMASLTAVAAANSGLTSLDPSTVALGGLDPLSAATAASAPNTSASITGANNPFVSQFNLANAKSANLLEQQQIRTGIKALDFCYDDQSVRFSIIDSINLCVTVVAYATHAYR